MKSLCLSLCFLFSFVLCISAKEYKNTRHGYSITIPDDWQVFDDPKELEQWRKEYEKLVPAAQNSRKLFQTRNMVVFMSPIQKNYPIEVDLIASKKTFRINEKHLKAMVAGVKEAIKNPQMNFLKPKIISYRIIHIGSVPVIEIKLTNELYGTKLVKWSFMIPGRGRAYMLNILVSQDRLAKEKEMLWKMIHSFKGAYQEAGKSVGTAYNLGEDIGWLFVFALAGAFIGKIVRGTKKPKTEK